MILHHAEAAGRVQLRRSPHLELRSVLPATESAAGGGAVHVALAAIERVLRGFFERRSEGRGREVDIHAGDERELRDVAVKDLVFEWRIDLLQKHTSENHFTGYRSRDAFDF